MELMQAVEHYATAMKLAERYGNKHGDVDAANNAWNECKKAADELAELRAWREKAFEAHPNIDLDIEAVCRPNKSINADSLRCRLSKCYTDTTQETINRFLTSCKGEKNWK